MHYFFLSLFKILIFIKNFSSFITSLIVYTSDSEPCYTELRAKFENKLMMISKPEFCFFFNPGLKHPLININGFQSIVSGAATSSGNEPKQDLCIKAFPRLHTSLFVGKSLTS